MFNKSYTVYAEMLNSIKTSESITTTLNVVSKLYSGKQHLLTPIAQEALTNLHNTCATYLFKIGFIPEAKLVSSYEEFEAVLEKVTAGANDDYEFWFEKENQSYLPVFFAANSMSASYFGYDANNTIKDSYQIIFEIIKAERLFTEFNKSMNQ